MHVAIDTSILDQDPQRKRAEFKALARLAAVGEISIHIPDVVRKEFLSHQMEWFCERLERLHGAAKALSKHRLPKALEDACATLDGQHESNRMAIDGIVSQEFDEWLQSIGGAVVPIGPHHSGAVVASYFQGSSPFKRVKERDGFPDAFIVEAMRDVLIANGALHVVAADNMIRDAFGSVPGVSCYGSIKEFLASPNCQALLKQHYAATNFAKLICLLAMQKARFAQAVQSNIADELRYMTVDWPEQESGEAHLVWDFEPSADVIEFFDHDADYYGDGVFVLPFSILDHCIVSYPLFKSDYWIMDDEDSASISVTKLNEHYYDAEQDVPVHVAGQLTVEIDGTKLAAGDLKEKEIVALLERSKCALDSITDLRVEQCDTA